MKPIIPEPEEVWVERKERVMGFRVQLHSTTSIDEAQQALSTYRSRLDSLEIDAGRIDMVFDAPYYKIRAGDFMVKGEADMLTDTLRAEGIPEAWVVRDNIFRMIRERQQD
ncbi:MAG: SPOR domain-containing protein [Bacteroidetes bacterium]|nr:SPOR domain-containing protein [Bacteroidota bacterium]